MSLIIYNWVAQQIRRLVVGAQKSAGYHASVWGGADDLGRSVASVVYFARFRSGDFAETRRMVLIR